MSRAAVSPQAIAAAAKALRDEVVRTPCVRSPTLSALTGGEVLLKLESLQRTGSFKERGAFVKLDAIRRGGDHRGVIAASAGNHAQGVAYHAARIGLPATIVMPRGTPFVKIERTRRLGAEIVLEGEDLAAADEAARTLARERRLAPVHPYDDPAVIIGQGSVGVEVLDQVGALDAIVVPIGGGGLAAGVATAIHAARPEVSVLGVEVASHAFMHHALRGGDLPPGGATLADGIAVKRPGRLTLPIVERLVEDLLIVDESAIEAAVQRLAETERLVVEGAGAASYAALLADPERFQGRRTVLVVSGGNVDSRLLASVLMRGLVHSQRLAGLRLEVSDQPGSLARITALIARLGGNIVEVHHQRWYRDVPVKMTEIDVLVEIRDGAHCEEIVAACADAGMPARLVSTNAHAG